MTEILNPRLSQWHSELASNTGLNPSVPVRCGADVAALPPASPQPPSPALPVLLFPDFDQVVWVIRNFNRARIAYILDSESDDNYKWWNEARVAMQGVLNNYLNLSYSSRHCVDICIELWSATDVCYTGNSS